MSTSNTKLSASQSWRKLGRSKFYCGSVPGRAGEGPRAEAKAQGEDKTTTLSTGRRWEDWRTLSKRQRQRRREGVYWDKVLEHAEKQLRRQWIVRRWKEARDFYEAIEEHLKRVADKKESSDEPAPAFQEAHKKRSLKTASDTQAPVRMSHVCLVDALRSLGVNVPYTEHGPLWALRDGNRLLQPHGTLWQHEST